jgi:murein DD-endopeptidase MepM/ murein hydrolase activator NlpD
MQLVRIYTPPADPVAIDPPLAGEWAMLSGGRSALVSHHYPTPIVSDAVDFMRLAGEGRGYQGDPKRAESWYGFGDPVLAPADGTVVSVSDVHPDEPIGEVGQRPTYGNHIVLEIGDRGARRYAVLAHLERGSARVGEGERVRVGQQIAAVGDSGRSLWPHLHIHVQEGPELDQQARTVPIVFHDVVLIRDGRESVRAEADLRRGDHIRPIED